jgi:hypothetical protein
MLLKDCKDEKKCDDLRQELKRMKKVYKKRIKMEKLETKVFIYFDAVRWIIHDVLSGKSYFKLFGIWCFAGYYGQGKTIGMVQYAHHIIAKHPELHINLYANFTCKGQNGFINTWHDLLDLPPNTIVLFDEMQNTFESTKFKEFPIELLHKMTQCRKSGLAIFCTSPVYNRIDIKIRESTDYVVECTNVMKFDRLFKYNFFRADKYEKYNNGTMTKIERMRYCEFSEHMIATDRVYNMYDTNNIVERSDIEGADKQAKINKMISVKELVDLTVKEIKRMKIA